MTIKFDQKSEERAKKRRYSPPKKYEIIKEVYDFVEESFSSKEFRKEAK